MKELKIKIKDEKHSREVQECLFALDYFWVVQPKVFKLLNSNHLYAGNGIIMHTDGPLDDPYFEKYHADETTLEELQEMAKEKNDLVDASWVEKEFEKGDRVFDTEIGWCEIERVNKSNVYLYETKRTCFNGYGQTDSASLRQLFHSAQEASEYFANIKEPVSKEKEMLEMLTEMFDGHCSLLSMHRIGKLIEYFKGVVRD